MKVKLSEKTCRKPLRGNWVLVNYCNVKFPGEIVNIVANECDAQEWKHILKIATERR